MKRLNFMCIGSTKSATTSLYEILKQHPEIRTSSFKEPHFFDNSENYEKGREWYLETYFSRVETNQIIGEFTPTYLSSEVTPSRILESFGPEIKFIVILRNPIERAYSHFLHTRRDEHERLTFIKALDAEKNRLSRHQESNDEISLHRFSYVYQGLYSQHISNYLKYFSINQFHFVLFDDFINKRDSVIRKILVFLEVDSFAKLEININVNQSSVARSKRLKRMIKNDSIIRKTAKLIVPSLLWRQKIRNTIHALNNVNKNKSPLLDSDRKWIYSKYFKTDINKLEKMLNLDLNHWKEC